LNADRLPQLTRRDYVQKSNGSAWMTNPLKPLTGFSPLVSRENVELNGRTRFALNWLIDRKAMAEKVNGPRIGVQDVQDLLMSDQVYLASLTMKDLLRLCREASAPDDISVNLACDALEKWDGTAAQDSGVGFIYFYTFMDRALKIGNVWSEPFNPALPLSTPRGLNLDDAPTKRSLKSALSQAALDVMKLNLPENGRWGDIQITSKATLRIPIHGGSSNLGIYNGIHSGPFLNGKREVRAGSSYIQVVSFDDEGPVAKTILTFSESSNPASEHYADQTELFSRKQWVELPFSRKAIEQDPHLRVRVLHGMLQ